MDDFMPVYANTSKLKTTPAIPSETLKAQKQLATAKMRGWMTSVLKVTK
jgi:hypothetical protein